MALRLVFMGTPLYALASLEALLQAGHEVAAVVTQPDRPRGRGGRTQPPPVKQFALEHGIPVLQPEKIRRDGVAALAALRPELCVTAAYGQILSREILAIPPLGTVNVHASLLPAYRGSSPVAWCLINGESRTGVTTMMTDEGIDTGDILLQEELTILPGETAGELTLRLARLGAGLLLRTLELLEAGTCPRRKQEEARASAFPMLSRDLGNFSFELAPERIVNLVRGLNPWPLARMRFPEGPLSVMAAQAAPEAADAPAGTPLPAEKGGGLLVAARGGAVRILRIKAPGGREMPAEDYLRGHRLPAGWNFETGAAARGAV